MDVIWRTRQALIVMGGRRLFDSHEGAFMSVKVCKTVGCGQENANTARSCSKCELSLVGVMATELADSTVQDDKSADASVPKQAKFDAPGGEDACVSANAGSLSHGYMLEWPWGRLPVGDGLFVGRVPPVPEVLVNKIEGQYNNVSRMHAELFFESGHLYLRDLDSTNGTFISKNGVFNHTKREQLHPGDKIRFGANLEVMVFQFTS